MNNQDYFINRYFETLKTILNNDKQITKQSRHFIDNYFYKLENLIVSNEESEAKEIFLKNHYLLMDVYTSNMKILLPDEDISDSDDELENIKLITAKKKEQKPKIPHNKPEPKIITPPNNTLNNSFVTFEEQHTNILTNKNLLR